MRTSAKGLIVVLLVAWIRSASVTSHQQGCVCGVLINVGEELYLHIQLHDLPLVPRHDPGASIHAAARARLPNGCVTARDSTPAVVCPAAKRTTALTAETRRHNNHDFHHDTCTSNAALGAQAHRGRPRNARDAARPRMAAPTSPQRRPVIAVSAALPTPGDCRARPSGLERSFDWPFFNGDDRRTGQGRCGCLGGLVFSHALHVTQ